MRSSTIPLSLLIIISAAGPGTEPITSSRQPQAYPRRATRDPPFPTPQARCPRRRNIAFAGMSRAPGMQCTAERGGFMHKTARARARSRERRLLSKRGHSACDCFDKSSLKAIVSVTPAISTAFNYAALPRKSESIDPSRASHRPATRYAERLPLRCSRNLVTPLIPPVLSLQLDVHGNQLIIIMRAN
jgi:hypothetical protein